MTLAPNAEDDYMDHPEAQICPKLLEGPELRYESRALASCRGIHVGLLYIFEWRGIRFTSVTLPASSAKKKVV